MKKTLILASLIAFSLAPAFATETTQAKVTPTVEQTKVQRLTPAGKPAPHFDKAKTQRVSLDKRLNLTEEQKAQAKELRQKSIKEIKPLMEQLKPKYEALKAIKQENISEADKKAKIAPIKAEIKDLNKKIHELRVQNMKDFEAILTPKQQKELTKIKQQGRKEFAKKHPQRHFMDGQRPIQPYGKKPFPPKPEKIEK